MSRFNLFGLYQILKACWSAITQDEIKTTLVSEKIKDDTIIHFKNGSSITLLPEQVKALRGNRAKIFQLYNNNDTADYRFDDETLDEVLVPFCKERENNDIDGN